MINGERDEVKMVLGVRATHVASRYFLVTGRKPANVVIWNCGRHFLCPRGMEEPGSTKARKFQSEVAWEMVRDDLTLLQSSQQAHSGRMRPGGLIICGKKRIISLSLHSLLSMNDHFSLTHTQYSTVRWLEALSRWLLGSTFMNFVSRLRINHIHGRLWLASSRGERKLM